MRRKMPFLKLTALCLSINALLYSPIYAEEVEFDERFLNMAAGQPKVDVDKYRLGNPIPSGEYLSDVYVNGQHQGRLTLLFVENEQNPTAGLCFTSPLQSVLSLKSEAFKQSPDDKQCLSAVEAIPDADIQFDLSSFSLNVQIPQVFVIKRPKGYISPDLFQSGNSALFVRYDANHYLTKTDYRTSKNSHLSLRGGANLAGWALRHQGSKSWREQKGQPYQYQYTYLQKDIDFLRGQLTLGDFFTNSYFFETVGLRGARLESDERMLPYSQRSYAPRIEGVAYSDARIIVRQNEHIIYETTVPAGAFRIDDLTVSGYSGNLEVEIIESDGSVRRFVVPYSNAISLVRKGQMHYKFSLGRERKGTQVFDENLIQGEVKYGLFNGITLNAGTLATKNYWSGLLGFAFDTPIGAFSTDANYSRSRFPKWDKQIGHYGVNVSYNAKLQQFGSYFSVSAYRSFSPEHYSLAQVLETNRALDKQDIRQKSLNLDRLQQKVVVSLSQSFGENWGGLSLSGVQYRYWSEPKPIYEYQASYSNQYKWLQYQMGYAEVRDFRQAENEKRFFVNLSLPLGRSLQAPRWYSNYNRDSVANRLYSSLSGSLGQDNQFNYNLSTTHQAEQHVYAANIGYKAPVARVNVGVSKSRHAQQTSIRVSGAIVAHPKGVTLANDLGETFAIIHAKGASGAKVNNSSGTTLDWFGNGIVPYLSPYQKNYVSLDPNNLPENVEVEATGQEVIPRANSVSLVKFATKTGEYRLFDISLADGSTPPLAAEVFDEQDQHIGYVVQGGQLFVQGVAPKGKLNVIWGASAAEQCSFNYVFSPESDRTLPIVVQCVSSKE